MKALPTESSRLTEESSLLEMDLVQEYLMIPLDIFLKSQHNISSKLEANRLRARIEANAKIDRDYKKEGDETT